MFEKTSHGIALEADGTVRIAQLTGTPRNVTLTGVQVLEPEGSDPFSSWEGALEKFRQSGADPEGTVVGLPDSLTYRKSLHFPFSSHKRVRMVLDAELDGEIPLPVGAVVSDYIAGEKSDRGLQVTAIACEKGHLGRLLEMPGLVPRLRGVQTGAVGMASAALRAGIVDGVVVRCTEADAILVEVRASRVRAIRRLPFSGVDLSDAQILLQGILQHTVTGDTVYMGCQDLHESIREGLAGDGTVTLKRLSDLKIVDSPSVPEADRDLLLPAVGLALRGLGLRESLGFDLRQGPFAQVTPMAGLKGPAVRTAILLFLLLSMGVGSLFVSLDRARGQYQVYSRQLEEEFRGLFPASVPINGQETGQIAGELEKLKRKMADLSGLEGHGTLTILTRLSAAIPAGVPLKLDELSYDSNKLRVEGSVASFDAVDRIKEALDSEPLFDEVQVQNAKVGADANRVSFRLQMEVR